MITLSDDKILGPQLDIAKPEKGVEVTVDGDRVWINVDGVCRLRAQKCPEIILTVNGRKVRAKINDKG